jgi:hypothetical protein
MERPQRVVMATLAGIGSSAAGFVLFWVWIVALAHAHQHGARNLLVVGVLPQVLLGVVLGTVHRWISLPIAAGMLLLPMVDVFRHGPYAECAYVVGWPVAIGGLAAGAFRFRQRRESTA